MSTTVEMRFIALSIISCIFLCNFLHARAPTLSITSRNIGFEDFSVGQRLKNESEKVLKNTLSKKFCALLCSKNSACLSFNFCGRTTCELNLADIFSIGAILETSSDCVYQGMKREEMPICQVGSYFIDIRDDNHPGTCEVNQKRQDAQWNEWVEIMEVNNDFEWKRIKSRSCHLRSQRNWTLQEKRDQHFGMVQICIWQNSFPRGRSGLQCFRIQFVPQC